METWLEVEDTYLTDQPQIFVGKGKARKQIPDPHRPPKEAYLFCRKMVKVGNKNKIKSRFVVILTAEKRGAKYIEQVIRDWIIKHDAKLRDNVTKELVKIGELPMGYKHPSEIE